VDEMAKSINKTSLKRQEVMNTVTDLIVGEMKKGNLPWEKGWSTMGLHHNITTPNKPYRGVNQFTLPAWCIKNDWNSNQWGTFKQWKEYSVKYAKKNGLYELDENGDKVLMKNGEPKLKWFGVQSGQKSEAYVVFWKLVLVDKKEKGELVLDSKGRKQKVKIPILKWFQIFNRDQTGLPPQTLDHEPPPLDEREEAFHDSLFGYFDEEGIEYSEGGDVACYSFSDDKIRVPKRDAFDSAATYWATMAHESIHSTGHAKRLERKMGGSFGEKAYAREELVAEMGAALLSSIHGFQYETMHRSAAYIQNWIKALNDDKKLIITAGTQASKAVDWVIDGAPKPKEDEKNE